MVFMTCHYLNQCGRQNFRKVEKPVIIAINWRVGASLPSRVIGAIFLYIYIYLCNDAVVASLRRQHS